MRSVWCLAILLALAGCASQKDQVFSGAWGKDCSRFVYDARRTEYPDVVAFVRGLPNTIFQCEYQEGAPIRLFGGFGKKLKINGREIRSGVGFALADYNRDVEEFATLSNFKMAFTEGFTYLDHDIKVRVTERPLHVEFYSESAKSFLVNISHEIVGTCAVGAFATFPFEHLKQRYRLYMWMQGYCLTRDSIESTFKDVSKLVRPPGVMLVEK